ncbi:hypothetical protein [Streptomyces fradiae]|uniref:hypothetical protein n=1 Tax=Streptomyces fradiae TaxID=1906 RepID=UPI003698868D
MPQQHPALREPSEVSMRDLLASCAAAAAVSTPPRPAPVPAARPRPADGPGAPGGPGAGTPSGDAPSSEDRTPGRHGETPRAA